MPEICNLLDLKAYGVSKRNGVFLFAFPILLTVIVGLLMVNNNTRAFGFWLLEENAPIEMLTFAFLMAGAFFGVWFSFKFKKHHGHFNFIFYLVFSIGLFLVAMEEIAWGQWFFFFETPEQWANINMQKETTLHNIEGLHGYNENLRLVFGLAGLLGIFLGRFKMFKKIGVPKVLFFWFFIIFLHSLADVLTQMDDNKQVMQRISELIEMLIGASALLYLLLNYKALKTPIKKRLNA